MVRTETKILLLPHPPLEEGRPPTCPEEGAKAHQAKVPLPPPLQWSSASSRCGSCLPLPTARSPTSPFSAAESVLPRRYLTLSYPLHGHAVLLQGEQFSRNAGT